MKLMYHVSFMDHPAEEPAIVERRAPVITR